MGCLSGSAVVKFKTYQMSNGREIMNIATREQTQMTEKYAAGMFRPTWHLLMSKSETVMSVET